MEIEVQNYPSNAYGKARQEEPVDISNDGKTESLTPKKVNAKVAKETLKGKIYDYILPEDVHDLKTYWNLVKKDAMRNIVVPGIKRILLESICKFLGGSVPGKLTAPQSRPLDRNSYDYSNIGSSNIRRPSSSPVSDQRTLFYGKLVFNTPEDAEFHKQLVKEAFDSNDGMISVLEFMEKAGQPTSQTQANYGWTSMSGYNCEYDAIEDGWVVTMPWPTNIR